MKIQILCAGKIKESFYREAIDEYMKRLRRYCDCRITEVDDGPDIAAEAVRLKRHLEKSDHIVTLEIEGDRLSSVQLADYIDGMRLHSVKELTLVIGGSDGLDSSIKNLADFHLSFSDMTFAHQLMRVILLEQLYRSFKIIAGEPYHK